MKLKSIYLLAGAIMMIAFASCKKELLKENTNPTVVTANQYNPNFLLSTVQLGYTGSSDFGSDNWQTEWGGIGGYIQHVSSTNTAFYYGDKYLYSPGNEGASFDQVYTQQVQQLVELYELTLNKPQYANLHRMAEIMRALVFQRLTDEYGDIPYFQAGLGYYDRIYTPVYDTQQSIYADMLKEVSGATDSLDVNGDKPTGDIYFASNPSTQIQEWKKFGASLLLRLAMRLTKVDPTMAQTWAKKAVGQTMQSNDDNAIVQHAIGSQYQNRDAWSILLEDSADLKLCSTFITSMKVDTDPRLDIVSWIYPTRDTVAADQIGLPPGFIVGGLDTATDITKQKTYPALGLDYYSRMNDDILNLTAPTLVVTYAETELLLADADQRWPGVLGDPTSAEQHYINGVTAAETQFTAYGIKVNMAAIANYVTKHPYNPATGLSQINTEYWKATLMDEYEAWANWRRTSLGQAEALTGPTGYPALQPTNYKGNSTGGTIPRRLQYPTDQSFSNLANYQAAVARLKGGDVMTSRVWWDTPNQN